MPSPQTSRPHGLPLEVSIERLPQLVDSGGHCGRENRHNYASNPYGGITGDIPVARGCRQGTDAVSAGTASISPRGVLYRFVTFVYSARHLSTFPTKPTLLGRTRVCIPRAADPLAVGWPWTWSSLGPGALRNWLPRRFWLVRGWSLAALLGPGWCSQSLAGPHSPLPAYPGHSLVVSCRLFLLYCSSPARYERAPLLPRPGPFPPSTAPWCLCYITHPSTPSTQPSPPCLPRVREPR